MKKVIYSIAYAIMYSSNIGYHLSWLIFYLKNFLVHRYYLSDIDAIKKRFFIAQGFKLNLKNPKTFNEKIQWLKLYDRRPIHTLYADKYAVRKMFEKKYGKEGLIELVYHTSSWKDITIDKIPDYPVIIKPNHGSGWYHIIEDKYKVDWKKIRTDCRFWLSQDYYLVDREWQYKNISRFIVVEKLLIPQDGGIPNNYRFHCLSGRIEVISVNIYQGSSRHYFSRKFNKNWEQLDFRFGSEEIINNVANNIHDIKKPVSYERMVQIAEDIAKEFAYVRVDFYEVDGKMFYGEITFHDSGGFDKIYPFDFDIKLGNMIQLN